MFHKVERRLRDPRVAEVLADVGLSLDYKQDFADKARLE